MDIAKTIRELGDTRHSLVWARLKELSALGSEVRSELREAWSQVETTRRQEIANALVELAEDEIEFDFHEIFLAALYDEDEEVRIKALEGLWEDLSTSLLSDMLEMVRFDKSGQVRASAAVGIARFAYLNALEELPSDYGQQIYDVLYATATDMDQPFEVRRRAIETLGYYGSDPKIKALIEAAYADPEILMKESAMAAMGRSVDETWLPIIESELQAHSPALRYEAVRAMGEMADLAQGHLARLLPLVDDEDTEIGLAAIWSLGQIGGPHAKRVLDRLARSKNEARSQAAQDALDELNLEGDD